MSKTSPINWYRQYDRTAKDISDELVKTRKEAIEPFMRLSSNGTEADYKKALADGRKKVSDGVTSSHQKVAMLRNNMESETKHPIYTDGLPQLEALVSEQEEFTKVLQDPKKIRKLVEEEFKKKLLPDLPFTKPGVFYQAGGIVTNPDGMQEMSLYEKDKILDRILPDVKDIPATLQQRLVNNEKRSKTFDKAIQDKAVQLFTEHEPQKDPTMAGWNNRYNHKIVDDKKVKQFGEFVNSHIQALDILQSVIENTHTQVDKTVAERDEQVISKLLPILAETGYDYLTKNRDKLITAFTESASEKSSNIEKIVEHFTYKKLAIDHEDEIKALAKSLAEAIQQQNIEPEELKAKITQTLFEIADNSKVTIDKTSLQEASEAIMISCTVAAGQSLTLHQRIAKITDSIKDSFPKIFKEYAKARKYSAILAEHPDIKGVLNKSQTPTSRPSNQQNKEQPSQTR